MISFGMPKRPPKRVLVPLRLTPEMLAAIDAEAAMLCVSREAWIRDKLSGVLHDVGRAVRPGRGREAWTPSRDKRRRRDRRPLGLRENRSAICGPPRA